MMNLDSTDILICENGMVKFYSGRLFWIERILDMRWLRLNRGH
jgi:hypothetical protein